MKFTIDTISKTIQLEEDVAIGDLLDNLKKIFPDTYQEYKLLQNKKIEYLPSAPFYPINPNPFPIIVDQWPFTNPSWPTIVTAGSTNVTAGSTN